MRGLAPAVCVAAVALAVFVGGTAAAQDPETDSVPDADLTFGQELSVLVAAEQTEVRSNVEDGAFEISFERDGPEAVERRTQTLRERLNRTRERKRALERERGEIPESLYRAKSFRLGLVAESINRSADVMLRETGAPGSGTDVGEEVRRLKRDASAIYGREVADIAQGGGVVGAEGVPGEGQSQGVDGRSGSNPGAGVGGNEGGVGEKARGGGPGGRNGER